MRKLNRQLKQFLKDESGPTAVEYAVLLALLVAVIITGVLTTGNLQNEMWIDTASDMESAINGEPVGN